MPDFSYKMQHVQFRLGIRLKPRWSSLQRSPDSLAGFGEGEGKRDGSGRKQEWKGKGEGEREAEGNGEGKG